MTVYTINNMFINFTNTELYMTMLREKNEIVNKDSKVY